MTHAFFAIMGGLACATMSPDDTFLPLPQDRATLTPEGILCLIANTPEAIPLITEEQIKDKSKADGLKKTLVCAQATWFCVQCITRLAQSLPVSLLEINTFAHALCTLVIYLLWWHKPLDVQEPTLITNAAFHPLLAFMWMASRSSADGHITHDIGGRLRDEFDCIWPFENPVPGDLIFLPRTPDSCDPAKFATQGSHVKNSCAMIDRGDLLSVPGRPEYSWRRYESFGYKVLRLLISMKLLPKYAIRRPPGLFIRKTAIDHLTAADVKRWKLAYSAIQQYDLEYLLRQRHASPLNDRNIRPFLAPRQANFQFGLGGSLGFAFAVSGALYGGLHLIAWNAELASKTELLLWRLSAICVACNGIPIGLGGHLIYAPGTSVIASKLLAKMRRSTLAKVVGCILLAPCLVVFPLIWISYVLARTYLVVESFRNLFYLPAGAYETPSWPSYVPHIT
ncbi:MAG: hypothetical protein Q9222_006745 [Ikaeria aurantiellina]